MTVVSDFEQTALSFHRTALTRAMEEIDAQAGVVSDTSLTHQDLRAMVRALMDAQGVTPEDNIGSRELLRMRYGNDWDKG